MACNADCLFLSLKWDPWQISCRSMNSCEVQGAHSLPCWAQDEPGDLESNYLITSSGLWDWSWAGGRTVSQNAQLNAVILAGCLRLSRSYKSYRLQKKFLCIEIFKGINISSLPFPWWFSLNIQLENFAQYFICKEQGNKCSLTWVLFFYCSREYGKICVWLDKKYLGISYNRCTND